MSNNPNTYDVYQLSLMPTPLRGPTGEARASSDGLFKDGWPEAAIAAVKCRWATTCPEDALAQVGLERLLPQNPNELTSAYRSRLLAAWQLWPLAGTKTAIVTALNLLGFPNVAVYENADRPGQPSPGFETIAASAITGATNTAPIVITAPGHGLNGSLSFGLLARPVTVAGVVGNTAANGTWNTIRVIDANTFELTGSIGNAAYVSGGTVFPVPEWWRFWVVINQPHGFVAPSWTVGDGTLVGAGARVGFSAAPAGYPAIRPTIQAWKPAHAQLVNVTVLLSGTLVGSGWTVGDGTVVGGVTALI